MENSNEKLTDEELRKKAYRMALDLKLARLDSETIYARLEKQGIPEKLAMEAARDVMIERIREEKEQIKPVYNFALIRIGIGVIAAIVSMVLFPGHIIFPVGLIVGGIVYALIAKSKMNQ